VNLTFAESLKAWNDSVLPGSSHLPIEQVLDRVVAPLSRHAPVLLLVVDGLSLPVLEELEPDVLRLGWSRLRPTEGRWAGVAVAALPTVTEISRASLLAGRLCSGTQANEKVAFASHEGLARARQGTPVLFHKGELSDGVALAPAVRTALSDSTQRVVGVVYNAIDDQLDGADQVHVRWTLEDLRLLPTLLHEARGAGRVIILTADHGHVLEWGTTQRPGSGSDRWRAPDGELREGASGMVARRTAITEALRRKKCSCPSACMRSLEPSTMDGSPTCPFGQPGGARRPLLEPLSRRYGDRWLCRRRRL
jgi:hypothetical protein